MTSHRIILAIIGGALLAVPYVAFARRSRHPASVFGAGLIVAAAIYVLFAVAAGDTHAAMIELGGLIAFGAFAACSLRWSRFLIGFGWLAHIAWDLFLHPVQFSGIAPWWYPAICIGFDILVAGFAFSTFWPGSGAGER